MFDLEHDANIWREIQAFAIGQRKQLVVVQYTDERRSIQHRATIPFYTPVQILNPFWIDISIEDNPVSFATLTTNIIHDFTKDVGEQTIVPLTRRMVERSIESVLVNCLGINDVGHTLDAVNTLQGRQQDLPSICFAAAGRAYHHETMLNLLNLVQLQDLSDPTLAVDQASLCTNTENLFPQDIQVHG